MFNIQNIRDPTIGLLYHNKRKNTSDQAHLGYPEHNTHIGSLLGWIRDFDMEGPELKLGSLFKKCKSLLLMIIDSAGIQNVVASLYKR